MALDPTISLQAGQGVTPLTNPMDLAMKAQAYQGGQLQLQQQKMAIQDEQKMRELASTGQYKTPDDLANAALESGVSPKTVLAFRTQGADYQNKVSSTAKNFAQAAAAGGQAAKTRIDLVNQQAEKAKTIALTANDADSYRNGLAQLDQQYAALGIPSLLQKYGDFTPQNRSLLAKNGATVNDAHAAAFGQTLSTPTGVVNVKQPLEPGAAPVVTPLTGGKPMPVMLPSGGTGFANPNPVTGAMPAGVRPIPPAQVTIANMGSAAPAAIKAGATGQDALNALSPQLRPMVQGIVDGRQKLPSGMALKTPYWQNILQSVYAVDPQWSEQRAQIRSAFTTGKDGTNIGSLNTATVHLADYLEAAKAMKNGTFTPGNELYNKISSIMGRPAPTDLATFSNIVSGEMANALKGTATDIEIHNIKQTMQNSSSPDQFLANGVASLKAMYQKLNTYSERYKQQIPNDTWSPVLPSARSVFQQYDIGGHEQNMLQTPSAPKLGTVEGGYVFLGGDPSNPKSWKKQ